MMPGTLGAASRARAIWKGVGIVDWWLEMRRYDRWKGRQGGFFLLGSLTKEGFSFLSTGVGGERKEGRRRRK